MNKITVSLKFEQKNEQSYHLRADKICERWLRLPDVLGNLLVNPGPDTLLHQLIVHQVPVYRVLEQGGLVGRDLLNERLDVLLLVVHAVVGRRVVAGVVG